MLISYRTGHHLSDQVGASGRNDPGSTFSTSVSSNFSIGVRNTTDHDPPHPIREAFSFQFSVTIHLTKISMGNNEYFYGKCIAEVALCVKRRFLWEIQLCRSKHNKIAHAQLHIPSIGELASSPTIGHDLRLYNTQI